MTMKNLTIIASLTIVALASCTTQKEGLDSFKTQKGTSISLHCIKHGSLYIQYGDKVIYLDPVTTAVPPETDYTTMPKADYIFVTHEHADHLDSIAILQLSKPTTRLIVNPRCAEILGTGQVMCNGEMKDFDGFAVQAVPAYNITPGREMFHPQGRDNGYVFDFEGFRIYVAGDTEDIPEMADIVSPDVAFLPCNQPYTMTPEQLVKATKALQPKVLFPYHYGQTDVSVIAPMLEGSGVDVRIRQYQ